MIFEMLNMGNTIDIYTFLGVYIMKIRTGIEMGAFSHLLQSTFRIEILIAIIL